MSEESREYDDIEWPDGGTAFGKTRDDAEAVAAHIIEQLMRRFRDGSVGQDAERKMPIRVGSYRKLHDKLDARELHLHADELVDVFLPKPYNEGHKFQSDRPRQVGIELWSRLMENTAVVRCEPTKDTAKRREDANALEQVLNSGIQNVQDRTGLDIQGALADGLIHMCYGVLHWRLADDIWPEIPEPEEWDELPGDADRKDYTRSTKDKKYREKPDAYKKRVARTKASAGFPWMIECLQPSQFYYLEDNSLENGLGMAMVTRVVGLMDYGSALKKSDNLVVSLNQENKRFSVYMEREAPPEYSPSGYQWSETRVQVAELWTRDEYYELCAPEGGGWTLVKACAHPYGMPPFVRVPANEYNTADPAIRFQPALEGLYRQKPAIDRAMSLFLTLAESIAIPYYYLEAVEGGGPLLDESGQVVTFSRNAPIPVPRGYKISSLPYEMNPAYVELNRFLNEEFDKAAPSTGKAPIEAATKPWTARLGQSQENVEPKKYLRNIARGFQTMVRNMAMVMSMPKEEGGTGPVYTFAYTKGGDVDYDNIVGIEPEQIRSINLSVTIQPESTAERITLEEHGRDLLNDEKVGLTLEEYVEDFEGKPNADEVVAKRRATRAYEQYIEPGLIRVKIAEKLGQQVLIAADGAAMGPMGQPMSYDQALAAKGHSVQRPQPQPGSSPGTVMPSQGTLNAGPTALPIEGQ